MLEEQGDPYPRPEFGETAELRPSNDDKDFPTEINDEDDA